MRPKILERLETITNQLITQRDSKMDFKSGGTKVIYRHLCTKVHNLFNCVKYQKFSHAIPM